MTFRLCADIGGTFTDVYARREDGRARSIKAPTTPEDLTEGLFDAFEATAAEFDRTAEGLLDETERLIHGTTVATNAIIEGEVETTALICTEGFRDTLVLREGGKENPYDWDVDYPDPYVPRALTFGVEERITAEGDIRTELDEEGCREVVREIAGRGVEAVAVSLLWAHANPVHERRVGEIIAEEAPGLHYSLGSSVCPILREYRRTSATAIDASLYGVVDEYLGRLRGKLDAAGFEDEPMIITANGGVMGIDEVRRAPIWLVDAGPTMFPVAAGNAVEAETGTADVIALDMGGTSLDMGVVEGGSIPRTRDATVGDGHTLGIEKVEVESIGSGGGSIARVDAGGLLHVGPESAGADPGPACYGRGGTEPTVTDAALVLGYLDEEYFLGGEMAVSREAAERALEAGVGDALGLDAVEAAHAVYTAANQTITNGVKGVTVERGIDPRSFVLSGGGGALGIHAVPIARELRIEDVLLPRNAGVVSAVGGLTSDVRRDFSESRFTTAGEFDADAVNGVLSSLASKAEAFFDRAGIPESDRSLSFLAEARYPNQVWELEVELPVASVGEGDVETLTERFHETHEATYGFKIEEQDVEFLQWRVEAVGETSGGGAIVGERGKEEDTGAAKERERQAYFDGEAYACPAYRADELSPGDSFEGPAFVDADTTTVALPPGASLAVTEYGNYHISP